MVEWILLLGDILNYKGALQANDKTNGYCRCRFVWKWIYIKGSLN